MTSQTVCFTSRPQIILSILHPRFLLEQQEWFPQQHPDLSPDTNTCHHKDVERPEWQHHTKSCLAFLTSLTVPPLPHTQNHGVHFQTQPGSTPRHSYQNGIRLTAPSLLGWTSIPPAGLLKTEPPIDATRRLIILHPVATTTPHNVSGNAVAAPPSRLRKKKSSPYPSIPINSPPL